MSTAARSILRLIPPLELLRDEPAVVAEILADGTVRALDPGIRARVTESRPRWASGTVSDGSWTMWWERRSS